MALRRISVGCSSGKPPSSQSAVALLASSPKPLSLHDLVRLAPATRKDANRFSTTFFECGIPQISIQIQSLTTPACRRAAPVRVCGFRLFLVKRTIAIRPFRRAGPHRCIGIKDAEIPVIIQYCQHIALPSIGATHPLPSEITGPCIIDHTCEKLPSMTPERSQPIRTRISTTELDCNASYFPTISSDMTRANPVVRPQSENMKYPVLVTDDSQGALHRAG